MVSGGGITLHQVLTSVATSGRADEIGDRVGEFLGEVGFLGVEGAGGKGDRNQKLAPQRGGYLWRSHDLEAAGKMPVVF